MIGDRRGEYGVDAPYALIGLTAGTLAWLAAAVRVTPLHLRFGWPLLFAALFGLSTLSFLWTTRQGKFVVWADLLDGLSLRGDERLLDVGCGRGAVLFLAAKRLTSGKAVGLDLWSTRDQSGNSVGTTLRNAAREGVQGRIELHSGDMRRMPFADGSFDVVTSSLAIHNISDRADREKALAEILRVLKPGGVALLADIRHAGDYQRYFTRQSGVSVMRRGLGWRFWYGGPHVATSLITVRKS
jgi:arsenite methyltransferase